jgi:hypothetical protein
MLYVPRNLTVSDYEFCPSSVFVLHMILRINTDYSPNTINHFIFVMEMRCVLFKVRIECFKCYLDEMHAS